MKRKIMKAIALMMVVFSLMFAEYRIIMNNIEVHLIGSMVAIEVFNTGDKCVEYYDWDEWL